MTPRQPEHSESTIKTFEHALERYSANPSDPDAFERLAALLAPGLFKGQGSFFDHACAHATSARGGELLPALFSFMDRLTSQGEIPASEASAPIAWRSACILAELHPEDEAHDPRWLLGLDPLRAALAMAAGCGPESASLPPLALDLRTAKPGFDLFRFAMLPTQAEAIGLDALRSAHPNESFPDRRHAPARQWKALGASFAYLDGKAPGSAAALLTRAIGGGAEFPCSYELGGEEFSAVLAIKGACDPFSCCSRALEPEILEIKSDIARILSRYAPADLCAIIEPGADRVALTIHSLDGHFLDAVWMPPIPESVALAHALLLAAAIPVKLAQSSPASFNPQGERLWATPLGLRVFDIETWRSKVLLETREG